MRFIRKFREKHISLVQSEKMITLTVDFCFDLLQANVDPDDCTLTLTNNQRLLRVCTKWCLRRTQRDQTMPIWNRRKYSNDTPDMTSFQFIVWSAHVIDSCVLCREKTYPVSIRKMGCILWDFLGQNERVKDNQWISSKIWMPSGSDACPPLLSKTRRIAMKSIACIFSLIWFCSKLTPSTADTLLTCLMAIRKIKSADCANIVCPLCTVHSSKSLYIQNQ